MKYTPRQTERKSRELVHICGDTYYINLGAMGLTAYKLSANEIILLDCGMGMRDYDELEELLERNGLRVTSMLASHCHPDHIGGSEKLRGKYGTKLYFPTLEADATRSYRVLKSNYPFVSLRTVQEFFGGMHCAPDYEYNSVDHELAIDGATFQIIQTPGHSVANTCIVTPDNVMYLGDTAISEEEMNRNMLAYTCVVDMAMESMEKIRDIDCGKYIVAHNGVYDAIGELLDANIDFHKKTTKMVEDLITRPMGIEEIIAAFYDAYGLGGRDMVTCTLIERSLRPYVEYLWDLKRISCIFEKGVIKYVRVGA